jgi:hypothetical protein
MASINLKVGFTVSAILMKSFCFQHVSHVQQPLNKEWAHHLNNSAFKSSMPQVFLLVT